MCMDILTPWQCNLLEVRDCALSDFGHPQLLVPGAAHGDYLWTLFRPAVVSARGTLRARKQL